MVIGGKVYIGEGEGGDYKVLEYTIQGAQWREIATPVDCFGMAVVNKQFIIIGGEDEEWCLNEVWVPDYVSCKWTRPFPAMPTARCWLSAVGYKRWVLNF